MLKRSLLALALGFSALSAQAAYVTYTGFDQGLGENSALASTPNSSGAETNFKNQLVGVGTETFESHATGLSSPLNISFAGAGIATLSGGGSVASVTPGYTNGAGRYSIPSASSRKYWEVSAGSSAAGTFSIAFSQSIAAFGFYGVDIGDFNGTLSLQVSSNGIDWANMSVSSTPNVIGGSVLYFGVIAGSAAEDFNQVRFTTTGGTGDIFAFDNFTIGSRDQICTVNCGGNQVPEPGSLALLGLGLAGLAAASRRRKNA